MAEIQKPGGGLRQQLTTFVSRLSTAQKIFIASVAALSLGALFFLMNSVGAAPQSVLFSELQEKDVALIVEKLKERNIDYELVDRGRTIMVPTDVLYETRLDLASEGLPQSSVVGYEIFDKPNLGMSDFVQKLNYRRALEGELSRTIMTMDEVEQARVHIVIPEKALFEKDQKNPSASVVMHLKSGRRISRVNVEGIQNLVASSVEGMDPVQVKVMDQKARVLSEQVKDPNTLAGLSSTQYEQKQKVDGYLAQKVQTLLDEVLGMENAVVRVDAELDFTRIEKTIEDYDADGSVVRSEQIKQQSSTSQDSLSYPLVNAESQVGNSIINYEIPKTIEHIVSGVGAIKRLTVAVLVNGTSRITTNADGESVPEYVPRGEEELAQLRQIVRNAVGYDAGRNDQISVVNMAFDTEPVEFDQRPDLLGVRYSPQDLIELGLLVLAMLVAVFTIRRLIASPQVRSRIERVLAPSDLEKQRVELARAAAERQQRLLKSLADSSDFLALPETKDERELAESAKSRLEMLDSPESAEEQAYKKEMRQRVFDYLTEEPDEASKLIKSMLRQEPSFDLKKKKQGSG